jgi:hypothetical protein
MDTQIDMSFFRATATVIPTLLIAVVFTGKLMDTWKLELDEGLSRDERQNRIAEYVGGITFVGWLLMASIVGLGASLAALASSNAHFIYLVLAVVAIAFQLTCLGAIVLSQAIDRAERHGSRQATLGYLLIGIGLVVFVALVLTAALNL